jgi:hypothetical protein
MLLDSDSKAICSSLVKDNSEHIKEVEQPKVERAGLVMLRDVSELFGMPILEGERKLAVLWGIIRIFVFGDDAIKAVLGS